MASIQDYLNGYTRNPIPNIGLTNSQVVFPTATLSTYNPQVPDYKLASQSSQIAENRRYKAAESSAGIDAIFSTLGQQLHQDAETASWFEGFKNKYKGEVDNYLLSGDYGNAIFYAKQAAAKAAQDPELLARIKSNSEYQTQKNAVDNLFASGKIGQVTRDRWLDQNKYHFDAVRNDVGEVIGGKGFTANWMPVEQQDLTDFYEDLQAHVTRRQGSSEQVVFLDKDGKETTNPRAGVYGIARKTGTRYNILSQQELWNAASDLWEENPKLKASIEQDWKNAIWEYNKSNKDSSLWGTEAVNENGDVRSIKEYVYNRMFPDLKHYKVNEIYNSIQYGTAYDKYRATQAQRDLVAPILDASMSKGVKFEVDNSQTVANAYNDTFGALTTLLDVYNKNNGLTRSWINSSEFKKLKEKGDYVGIANFFAKHYIKGSQQIDDAIRVLRHEGKILQAATAGLNESDRKAVEAYAAITSGYDIPDAKNNSWGKKWANARDKIFSYYNNGEKVYTNSVGLEFDNQNTLNDFVKRLGLNKSELENNGINLRTDGGIYLEVDKNSPYLKKIATLNNLFDLNIVHWNQDTGKVITQTESFSNSRQGKWAKLYDKPNTFKHTGFPVTGGVKMENNGPYSFPFFNKKQGNLLHAISDDGIIKELADKNAEIFNKKQMSIVSTPMLSFSDWNVRTLYNSVGTPGGLNLNNAKSMANILDKANQDLAIEALSNAQNDFDIWKLDEDGVLRPISQKEQADARVQIVNAMSAKRALMNGVLSPTNDGFGTLITIKSTENKQGKTEKQGASYFVGGLLHNQAAMAALRVADNQYLDLFRKNRALGVNESDIFGNTINYNNPNAIKSFAAAKTLETAMEATHDRAINNIPISDELFVKTAEDILNKQGFVKTDSNNDVYNNMVMQLVSKLRLHYNNSIVK